MTNDSQRIEEKNQFSELVQTLMGELSISAGKAFDLLQITSDREWKLPAIRKLMSGKLRSDFKIKLRQQVREWLDDSSPAYPNPLSPRQMDALHPMAFRTIYSNNRDEMERHNQPASHAKLLKYIERK